MNHTQQTALQRLYAAAGQLLPWLADSTPVAQVGLLDGASLGRPADFFDFSLRGAHKAMREAHLPATVVITEQIPTADLNVLLLANVRSLEPTTRQAIEEFVTRGGGLVMTHQTITAVKRLAKLPNLRHWVSVRKTGGEFPLHTSTEA